MGNSSDVRVAAVREAVAFWNAELERLGAGTRLGPMSVIENSVPEDALREASAGGRAGASSPGSLAVDRVSPR